MSDTFTLRDSEKEMEERVAFRWLIDLPKNQVNYNTPVLSTPLRINCSRVATGDFVVSPSNNDKCV